MKSKKNTILPFVSIFFLILLFPVPTYSENHGAYKVTIPNCEAKIKIVLPGGFRPANSEEEKKRKKITLDRFHQNKNRKAKYTDIFFADWNLDINSTHSPFVIVGSLGSTLQAQGRIDELSWEKLRAQSVSLAEDTGALKRTIVAQTEKLMNGVNTYGMKLQEVNQVSVFTDAPNSITILGSLTYSQIDGVDGGQVTYMTAGKMVYVSQCIAYANIGLPIGTNHLINLDNFERMIHETTFTLY